jgi:hypothetical protein
MNAYTGKGVNRRVYGEDKAAKVSGLRALPDPRYYVRMRLVRNILWMLFILFLLALGFSATVFHVSHDGNSADVNQATAPREPTEVKDH